MLHVLLVLKMTTDNGEDYSLKVGCKLSRPLAATMMDLKDCEIFPVML